VCPGGGKLRPPEVEDDTDDELIDGGVDLGKTGKATEATEQAEFEMQDMISFCTGISSDTIGNVLTPIFFMVCMILYKETQILYRFKVFKEYNLYFLVFYIFMTVFQFIIDSIVVNIVDLFHRWHVMDYLEFCQFRFITRKVDWQGRETTYDEMLAPSQRSIDTFCFSEQYYFVTVLTSLGMMSWMLGMQIIFTSGWNLFNDPASPVVLLMGVMVCRGGHILANVWANFLKIWVVIPQNVQHGQGAMGQQPGGLLGNVGRVGSRAAPPKPPPGSAHEGWPEPQAYDAKGMERYRRAFLMENQQWLQATFASLRDRSTITQHREPLLQALASLLGEVAPSQYTSGPLDDQIAGLTFNAPPAMAIARAAGAVQHQTFQGSVTQEILRMWRQRAQFMLLLEQASSGVKIEHHGRADKCELCGSTRQLVTTPIYTLTHLASTYRQQRDMSPLWNMPLWRHFYQSTPVCTVCERHARKYRAQNRNIPVHEKRFQQLEVERKTPFKIVMESEFPVSPIDAESVKVLFLWLNWTRELANGQDPREFLPRYGMDGRTAADIRRQQVMSKAARDADDASMPALSEDGEEEPPKEPEEDEEDEEVKKKKARPKPEDVDLDLENDGQAVFAGEEVPLEWTDQAILRAWLARARQHMSAPQLSQWSRPLPLPAQPDLPPPPPS